MRHYKNLCTFGINNLKDVFISIIRRIVANHIKKCTLRFNLESLNNLGKENAPNIVMLALTNYLPTLPPSKEPLIYCTI